MEGRAEMTWEVVASMRMTWEAICVGGGASLMQKLTGARCSVGDMVNGSLMLASTYGVQCCRRR